MNATAMNTPPSQAVQAQPPSGKQQDSATPEMPFSQVLSSEIAQKRGNSAPNEGSNANADAHAKRDAKAATPAETKTNPEDTAEIRTNLEDTAAATSDESPLALPQNPGAEAMIALPPTTGAEAMIAVAINPDQLRLTPAGTGTGDAETGEPSGLMPNGLPFQGARKGRSQLASQIADSERGMPKTDTALPSKANALTATTTAASVFAERLAAIQQPGAIKPGEFTADLMGHPAMRAASHAPLESPHTFNEVAAARLAPSLGTSAWNQALGEKLVWMAAGSQQTATLTLNPPNMGPLQIVLNISNEQATASFFSAQPEVRQALESAFPRLKEMLNEAGIELGQATVSADTPQQNDTPERQEQRIAAASARANEAVTSGQLGLQSPALHGGRGLVDTFA
ncbi:MAG: flagellar hook-length control protein FliK [Thiobacillus sp.]